MSALFEAGLTVTAIGMGVVFVLLTLMVGVIVGMSRLSAAIEGPAARQLPATAMAADETEVAVVIGAAIRAYRARHAR